MQCLVCKNKLEGQRKKFCSKKCSQKHYSKINQKLRGYRKKLKLVQLMGGKCKVCGYNKNLSALVFHHKQPQNKDFNLDSGTIANRAWDLILLESKKCVLLCHNCHSEMHNPDCNISNHIENYTNIKQRQRQRQIRFCIDCGISISKTAIRCNKCHGKTSEKNIMASG